MDEHISLLFPFSHPLAGGSMGFLLSFAKKRQL